MENKDEFTICDLSTKCRSKSELYNILIREGNIYLPPASECTQKYLRQIMNGTKEYLKWDSIKIAKIPQYKGLRVRDIISFAATKIDIYKYLPEYEYSKEPSREWLWNLVNSLIPIEFSEFVKEQVSLRKTTMLSNQNLCITAKKEFVDIFRTSKAVSLEKGKSHFLARQPKKNNYLIKLEKMEEESKYDAKLMDTLKLKINRLNKKIENYEIEKQENEDYSEKMNKLYQLGIIDEEGNLINNEMKLG